MNYRDLSLEQQKVADLVVRENGWMDFESYSKIKPTKGQELLNFAVKVGSVENLSVD